MRPGRQLAVLGLLFVILYALVFFVGTSGLNLAERLAPKLGLDLVGGTRVSLEARPPSGGAPRADQLEQARRIIESRVNSRGVSEAEVVTEGTSNIVISLPGQNNDVIRSVGEPAELRFRKVINLTQDAGDEEPEPSPSASAAPTPSGSASPAAAAAPTPGATPSAAPTTAAPATAAPTPSASATAAPPPGQADVQRKVGPAAWSAAMALTAPVNASQDPASAAALAPFKTLDAREVAALPPNIQFNVPYISCKKLNDRPAGSIQKPDQLAVACDAGTKYLLDNAKVLGTDVTKSDAVIDQQTSQWTVTLAFTGAGQERWTNLTREAVNNDKEPKCDQAALSPDDGHCLVAVVLDNDVVSAPGIKDVIPGNAVISGNFNKESANLLASQLRYGALPLTFEQSTAQSISASLGSEHLRAGLLAAGIGMLLVVIYAFFYYRLLGSVIFLSLVLSALLTFGMLVFLGREMGFTLTLAGIAGFIVSLGVAADSFVIYFERLKDEIRDGRSPRSAVPRAWARARRTIISANAISILAAVVLYFVSVGSVRGFAFALGLATLLDLIVVFLFRHPIMTMFANTKAFLSPRVSGLGRVLQHAPQDEPAAPRRPARPKEA